MYKKLFSLLMVVALMMSANVMAKGGNGKKFVKVEGKNLVKPDGSKLFIQGTNLGNWRNCEAQQGYIRSMLMEKK